ncbi:MAG: radical SAM protein [Flavobacteriia bacterium]|nr:radical SAM protein [Flavobacteriia bacterium]
MSNIKSTSTVDVCFISPDSSHAVYQSLSGSLAAIEPPTWALLLAQSVRSKGWNPCIIDANAERLSDDEVARRVESLNPRLVCFVVYGQNVNSGTTNMSGAVRTAKALKRAGLNIPISLLGSHIQALPVQTMEAETSFDFGFANEGVYSLWDVLECAEFSNQHLKEIPGLVLRNRDGKAHMTPVGRIVPSERLDIDLPGYAWDLLPYKNNPLDMYRSPLWHAEYVEEFRTPYAAIQTSLGCNFGCDFCMINIINRNDREEIGVASNYSKMRFWSPEFIVNEIDKLTKMGVRTIRIIDEMFLLYKKHYVPLCELLKSREYAKELRMWAYSRVDTVTNPEFLMLVRAAGIRWLALGIESARREIRLEVSKGKFQDVDIKKVVEQIHDADIEVMANFIVGLPGESREDMEATLQLSLDLCTSGWNMYAAMALPGSQLYKRALEKGYTLPDSYDGFSFHSFNTVPMPTEHLSAAEVLQFRDSAFSIYHKNVTFLDRIKSRFGDIAVRNIEGMTQIKINRKIVEEI